MKRVFDISTHAPRVGRNMRRRKNCSALYNFYSRAPSGAQPAAAVISVMPLSFLLTRPEWGATSNLFLDMRMVHFYSRAPSGAQQYTDYISSPEIRFLLTRPEWGATPSVKNACVGPIILLTRPEWGATVCQNRI